MCAGAGFLASAARETSHSSTNDRSAFDNPFCTAGLPGGGGLKPLSLARGRLLRAYKITIIAFLLLLLAISCSPASYNAPQPPGATPQEIPAEPATLAPFMQNTPAVIELTAEPTMALPVIPTVLPAPQQAVLPERRLLSLEWPSRIHVGSSDTIRLSLDVDPKGQLTPQVEVGGHQVTGQTVNIPDLYETHNIVAEARLDIAGLQISPEDTMNEPMVRGERTIFYWSVSPTQAGDYRGTLWLFLNIIPKNGGQPDRRPLLARPIEIQATTVLGLPANVAEISGVAGGVISTILGFPFLENIILAIWKWLKPQRNVKA
jgi:hypothetical protein